jgi:hypothetical protein
VRKVVFVGGTSFSGSTFFHLALANSRTAFACGEIRWLFHPHNMGHVDQFNRADPGENEIWNDVRKNDEKEVYRTIFEKRSDVEVIVDSSKNPFWIERQSRYLAEQGIGVENVLIWKTPLEYAISCNKRHRFDLWYDEWRNYHKLYSSVVRDWCSVRYRDIVGSTETLAKVCHRMGVPFEFGQEQFWNKKHYAFGGNQSAKFHLMDIEKAKNVYENPALKREAMVDGYRKIRYSTVVDEEMKSIVSAQVESEPEFARVAGMLRSRDVLSEGSERVGEAGDIRYPAVTVGLKRLKYRITNSFYRRRYGKLFVV